MVNKKSLRLRCDNFPSEIKSLTIEDYRRLQAEEHKNKTRKRYASGKRPDLDNKFFRSKWEANYARYLNFLVAKRLIVKWEYEPKGYEFTFPIKRGSRIYKPDFVITENDGSIIIHEVKGYEEQKGMTKLKRMSRYYPNIRIKLIDKAQYKIIERQFSRILPEWE